MFDPVPDNTVNLKYKFNSYQEYLLSLLHLLSLLLMSSLNKNCVCNMECNKPPFNCNCEQFRTEGRTDKYPGEYSIKTIYIGTEKVLNKSNYY